MVRKSGLLSSIFTATFVENFGNPASTHTNWTQEMMNESLMPETRTLVSSPLCYTFILGCWVLQAPPVNLATSSTFLLVSETPWQFWVTFKDILANA